MDLIEQELLDKPRDTVIIHMYLEPGASPVETLALIAARMGGKRNIGCVR